MNMHLVKIAEMILSPDFVIFFLLVVGVISVILKSNLKFAKWLLGVGVLLYYVFSSWLVAKFLLSPLEDPYRFPNLEPIKHIHTAILLDGGREADILRSSAILKLYYSEKTKPSHWKIIISGSDPLGISNHESLEVKQFLSERGIPPQDILIENYSLNTWQSGFNLKRILGQEPFLLVTSAYHMKRSLYALKAFGMNPVPYASDFKIDPNLEKKIPLLLQLIPSAHNLQLADIAIHEYGGLLIYRIHRRRQLQ